MMERKATRDRNKYESRLLELMSNRAVLDFSCELILQQVLNRKEICFRLDVLACQSELPSLSKKYKMNFSQHLVEYHYYRAIDDTHTTF